MTKLTLLMFAVFLTLVLYLNGVLTANNEDYNLEAKKRGGERVYTPLWFGPRIGRRKRNPSENIFKSLDREEMDALAGALKNPYALMALNADKRQMDFTPRLGRESGEVESDVVVEYIAHTPQVPRLGRKLSPYSPRLGRENEILLQ